MIDPGKALILFGMIVTLTAIFFYPKIGMISRWKRAQRGIQRVRIEDALKHLYDCEYKKIPCTVQSIAGTLVMSIDESTKLVTRLSGMGLLITNENGIDLTSDGRSYALRVIRMHRLWERFLADETSIPETEWHASAEHREHELSTEEVEKLAAQIGNPYIDPHGDPIPSSSGEMPPAKGSLSLLSLRNGDIAQITHIEDEPETIYAQLVAEGLYVGMKVMMIERSSDRIKIAADGDEIILAPIFANNITIVPIRTEAKESLSSQTLDTLLQGEEATVLGISKACRGQQRRRLMDLGIVPGTSVSAELRSIGGNPTAYNVRGALVALRRQHAQQIFIQRK